jgi:hypothetical protein
MLRNGSQSWLEKKPAGSVSAEPAARSCTLLAAQWAAFVSRSSLHTPPHSWLRSWPQGWRSSEIGRNELKAQPSAPADFAGDRRGSDAVA